MKRQLDTGIVVVGLALLGLVLAQDMMGDQANPNYPYAQGRMHQGFGMNQGFGHGRMGQQGRGMMGGMGMMQGGMMSGLGMKVYPATAEPIPLEDAQAQFNQVAQSYGPNILVNDVMAFSNNYYAQLVDAQGQGVAEVLVDRYTGLSYPEPGPNMMWNTRSGMMGFAFAGQPRYDETAAQAQAETFLATYLPGATVSAAQGFSGYTTFDFGREATEGMLSVNAYSGEVWVHSWHGTYLNAP